MNWRKIKSAERSFRKNGYSEMLVAQEVFHRVVQWLCKLMGNKRGREFMISVVDPDE